MRASSAPWVALTLHLCLNLVLCASLLTAAAALTAVPSYDAVSVSPQLHGVPEVAEAWSENDKTLDVYVIAHTHDDAGWIKTYDGYYYEDVKYILDTVMNALSRDPKRKFIWVEVIYFQKWWGEQTQVMQDVVRQVIKNGQLEFILGGYVMADGTVTHFSSVMDQMTMGHEWLYHHFGIVPTIGWYIDPFGHGAWTPTMLTEMGFESHVIARMWWQTKNQLKAKKQMEFAWKGSPTSDKAPIFTHTMFDSYCAAGGFYFEFEGTKDPVIRPENLQERADALVELWKHRAEPYATRNLMWTWGCDFLFENAFMMFDNMDVLLQYINANPHRYNVRARYAVPSEYLRKVRKLISKPMVWTSDFLPYSQEPGRFWSGFYTSRSQLKGASRRVDTALRNARVFTSILQTVMPHRSIGDSKKQIQRCAFACALVQHHDGVTGTARQAVVDDYMQHLLYGQQQADTATIFAISALRLIRSDKETRRAEEPLTPLRMVSESDAVSLSSSWQDPAEIPYTFEPLARAHGVWVQQHAADAPVPVMPIVLVNSLTRVRTHCFVHLFRLQHPAPHVTIVDAKGAEMPFEVLSRFDLCPDCYQLFINFRFLPGLGFVTVFAHLVDDGAPDAGIVPQQVLFDAAGTTRVHGTHTIENDLVRATVSTLLGLTQLYDKKTKLNLEIQMQFYEYTSKKDGAYIFQPLGAASAVAKHAPIQYVGLSMGKIVQQFIMVREGYSYAMRLYSDRALGMAPFAGLIEYDMAIGPMRGNRHAIARFHSRLANTQGTSNATIWYTDDSGYQEMRRVWEPSKYNATIPRNYYPAASMTRLTDRAADLGFSVLLDRTHGVSSQAAGDLEVMLHRRTLQDDHKGLAQPLNDTTIVYPKLWLGMTQKDGSYISGDRATVADTLVAVQTEPLPLFGALTTRQQYLLRYHTIRTYAQEDGLPPNVQLLSLTPDYYARTGRENITLRLWNAGPRAAQVKLSQLFYSMKVQHAVRVNMNGFGEARPIGDVVALLPNQIQTLRVALVIASTW